MHQMIFCTCPDAATADHIAHALVTEKLAACVNVVPGIRSVYEWQGQIETAQEHLLVIKSHRDRFAAIESMLKNLHPYQLPEIIAVSIENGSVDYLKWIDSCVATR